MRWGGVGRIQGRRFVDRLGYGCNRVRVENLVLTVMISFLPELSLRTRPLSYPACIGIEKPPPDTVGPDLLHPATSVQEYGKHTLAQINNLLVLFRVGRIGGVVSHGMLLGDGRDDESRVKSAQRIAKGGKLGVPPANLEILWFSSAMVQQPHNKCPTYTCPDCVHNVPAATLNALPSVRDQNRKLRVFIEDLFDATVVPTRLSPGDQLCLDFIIFVAIDRM